MAVGIAPVLAVVATIAAARGRLRTTGRVSAEVMHGARVRLFAHLQRLSLDFYTGEKAGVIMSRMTSDIENLQQLTQEGLVQFAVQGLTMLVVSVALFVYNAKLALITLFIIVPPLVALSLWFRSASDTGYLAVRDGIAGVLTDLSESLAGVRWCPATTANPATWCPTATSSARTGTPTTTRPACPPPTARPPRCSGTAGRRWCCSSAAGWCSRVT